MECFYRKYNRTTNRTQVMGVVASRRKKGDRVSVWVGDARRLGAVVDVGRMVSVFIRWQRCSDESFHFGNGPVQDGMQLHNYSGFLFNVLWQSSFGPLKGNCCVSWFLKKIILMTLQRTYQLHRWGTGWTWSLMQGCYSQVIYRVANMIKIL